MYQFVLYPDIDLCLGCKTCEIACAIEHSDGKDLFSAVLQKTKPYMDVVYVGIPVPMNCRHCDNAPCLEVCPTNAISRDDGPVIIDTSKCIGCRSCVIVCPYGAIRLERVAFKCDQCNERLANGLLPACVEACPVNALKFERAEEISKRAKIEGAKRFIRGMKAEREVKEIAMPKTTATFRDLIWVVR
ncbi:MAG: 4Fe-4S binding protein [Archaeoglobus sp.]|nr:4Fe-4S binding protein [Archaeoglobus sp.]